MGYHFQRIILPPGENSETVERLALHFRQSTKRVCSFTYSEFHGRNYKREFLKNAADSRLNFIELDTTLLSEEIIKTTKESLGENTFLYRESDDDELDIIYPSAAWLTENYPNHDFAWVIKPIEDTFKTNDQSFYSIPGNPEFIDVKSPIFAALLDQVKPGQEHPCPMCGQRYISKFPRRQCRDPECRFYYIPFENRAVSFQIKELELDAFAWGRCPRGCGKALHFNKRIEQCYKCGQLIKAVEGRFSHLLEDNESDISELLEKLKKTRKKWWQFYKST